MSSTPPPRVPPPPPRAHGGLTASASLRQLLDSLSREQRRNQELLASLAFALRSFTNFNRFLELVPLVCSRLVEAEGSLLVVFHADGRLWREQLHASPPERCRHLVSQLAGLSDQDLAAGGGGDDAVVAQLDLEMRRLLGQVPMFGTSVVARNHQRGRLYVFGSSQGEGPSWSDVHRRHVQLVADLTGVAIENELLQEDMRLHERLDRQLSTGAEIQSQLLPDQCPVIEGGGSCGPLPAGLPRRRRLLRLHPHPPRAGWTAPRDLALGAGDGRCDVQGDSRRPADDVAQGHAAGGSAERPCAGSDPA